MSSRPWLAVAVLAVAAVGLTVGLQNTAEEDGHNTLGGAGDVKNEAVSVASADAQNNRSAGVSSHSIMPASWRFTKVRGPLLITLFALLMGLCKIGFHYANWISSKVPESCLLIILGIVLGCILFFADRKLAFELQEHFSPTNFFLFFLPPIILEAAYSLHSRPFFDNIGSILLFAVVGTLLNTFMLALSLWGLSKANAMGDFKLDLLPGFLFSALISAVDPVAVLAIFAELNVNNVLYFSVFGESLLNDAVTVVEYETFETLLVGHVDISQVMLAMVTFFTVSIGGLLIGVIFGLLTALFTKYTENVPGNNAAWLYLSTNLPGIVLCKIK